MTSSSPVATRTSRSVPPRSSSQIIEAIRTRPEKTFYLQSKKPACFEPFLKLLPKNVILVTTLETNRDEGYDKFSKAPPPSERYQQFKALRLPQEDCDHRAGDGFRC
jgi:hypothetical protein